MNSISASEARQNFSYILKVTEKQPLQILKQNKASHVLLSNSRYEELTKLEAIVFEKAAEIVAAQQQVENQNNTVE